MPRSDLERPLIFAAMALLLLIVAVFVRGGGYGIGGLSWDTYVTVEKSSVRLGSFTVGSGDRVRSVNDMRVFRDADLRGVLRAASSDVLWLEIERSDFEHAIPLTPEAIAQDDLPQVLRGPYRVVAIDDRGIIGDMKLADMAAWMRANGNRPAVFTISVPEWTFQGLATRVKRPGPIIPVVTLVFTLAVVGLSLMRGRSEVMTRRRRLWHLLGLSSASGGVLLTFLIWHDGFLADPALLPFGLIAISLWRPLSLALHQIPRGELVGPSARFVKLGTALPATIVLLAAIYGWSRTIPGLFGTPLDGFVFDQMRHLVLVAASVSVLYHLSDLAVHGTYMRGVRSRAKHLNESIPWITMLVAALAVVTAVASASQNPARFLEQGYVLHFGILVGIQWLGDLALLPQRGTTQGIEAPISDATDLPSYLVDAQQSLGLRNPRFVCCLPEPRVMLSLPDEREEDEGSSASTSALLAHPVEERLMGLLELLDSEGGMIPRYKTIRGTDELDDDPFDGLDRAVGVSLVLPLTPPKRLLGTTAMRAYLVNLTSEELEFELPSPSTAALDAWAERFTASLSTWSDLRAAAAEGAFALPAGEAEVLEPVVADEPAQQGVVEPSEPAAPVPEVSGAMDPAIHYWAETISDQYPIDEPDLVDTPLLSQIQPFSDSRGPMLVLGEIGSGREFLCRLVHGRSDTAGPFVTLDCSRLPQALGLASLMGEGDMPGRLAASHSGTICIRGLAKSGEDVISEAVEAARRSNVRVALIEDSAAFEDVEVLPSAVRRAVDEAVLLVPSLREDPVRIERAAQFYLHRFAMRYDRLVTSFSEDAKDWLVQHPWPSNFHSLIACVRDGVLRAKTTVVSGSDLCGEAAWHAPEATDLAQTIEGVEREALLAALQSAGGNKSAAARALGMKRTTFLRKLDKYSD